MSTAVEGRPCVGGEIVQDHPYLLGLRVEIVYNVLHRMSELHAPTALLGYLYLSKKPLSGSKVMCT